MRRMLTGCCGLVDLGFWKSSALRDKAGKTNGGQLKTLKGRLSNIVFVLQVRRSQQDFFLEGYEPIREIQPL